MFPGLIPGTVGATMTAGWPSNTSNASTPCLRRSPATGSPEPAPSRCVIPKGPIKKDYVVVPRGFAGDRRKFKLWARQAIDHALTLPKPKR